MHLPWLAPGAAFPPTDTALDEPNGLLAAGADLTIPTLLNAYSKGIFPWYENGQPILWWTPDPRLLLFPEQLHVSRSLKKHIRKCGWDYSLNTDFAAVIDACSAPRNGEPGTWITTEMRKAYLDLHEAGHAHSVEIYQQDKLVGGLYGIQIKGAFFGESMFSRVTNASKVALAILAQTSINNGIQFIDCQVETPHLQSMGAINVPRQQFEQLLDRAMQTDCPLLTRIHRREIAGFLQHDKLNHTR